MERKKSTPADKSSQISDVEIPKFRWKVMTEGGFHGGNNRIYKPGEIFTATEAEIPLAFRDVIVKVDNASVQEQQKVIPGKVSTYRLQEREKTDPEDEKEEILYDVVNHKDKVLNESPLTKEKAELLIKDLSE